MSEIGTHPALHRAKGMHPVRFELTHPKILELESSALDHSATNACFSKKKNIYKSVLQLFQSLQSHTSICLPIVPILLNRILLKFSFEWPWV